MAAIAGVVPQALIANQSLLTLFEDSWCCKPVFNQGRVALPPTEKIVARRLEGRSWSVPTSGFLEECSISDHVVADKLREESSALSSTAPPRRLHSFDEAEIRAVFGMLDKNSDGVICKVELRQFMGIWGMDMSEAEAQSMIRSLDDNSDGEIDFDEFFSLYQSSLAGHDVSESVQMEKTEQEDREILSEAFRIFDKNNDGFISAQELQTVLVGLGVSSGKSLKQCQNMIASVDQDGNGVCDIHEFESMMSAQPFLPRRSASI